MSARPSSKMPPGRTPSVELPRLLPPQLDRLAARRMRAMLMAGQTVLECERALKRGSINLVSEVLRGQGEFVEHEHYPRDDVYDPDSRAQYYYHAHRSDHEEHGHFHTFLWPPGTVMRAESSDQPRSCGTPGDPEDNGGIAHLIGISMDAYGWPLGLFATNHWVTGGMWCDAEETIRLLPQFSVDHANPSWPVNRWIGAMLVLFRPYVETLLRHRDETIRAWAAQHPGREVLEDRELEITGYLAIDVNQTVQTLQSSLKPG